MRREIIFNIRLSKQELRDFSKVAKRLGALKGKAMSLSEMVREVVSSAMNATDLPEIQEKILAKKRKT